MSLEFLLFDRVVFVDTRKKNKYAYTTEIPKYFNEKGEKKKKRERYRFPSNLLQDQSQPFSYTHIPRIEK